MKILSLGKQEYSRIVRDECIYVDKTRQIAELLRAGSAYFLSRPRRFGKSLLVNTLKEIFLGNRELFAGTWIYDRIDWKPSPVIKLDFSGMGYAEIGLEEALLGTLDDIAASSGVAALASPTPGRRLAELIGALSRKHGPVAILVDEYDKPISDNIEEIPRAEANREMLKSFYGGLKSLDNDIRFLFITGVSKFSKVSLFSDLNHLTDLTTMADYATLLGYTREEVEKYFGEYLDAAAASLEMPRDAVIERMAKTYNGYSWNGRDFVYNPFSLQSFLQARQFKHYWFATGTTSWLVKAIQSAGKLPQEVSPIEVNESFFDKFDLRTMDLASLLFQTGYLTIKRINGDVGTYTLGYPNGEVESAFMNSLLEVWSGRQMSELGEVVADIHRSLLRSAPQMMIDALYRLFVGIPYEKFITKHGIEAIFTSNVYIALKIIGVKLDVEVQTAQGRIDAVMQGPECIFLAEFKMGRAEEAMAQIRERKYLDAYRGGSKRVFAVAVGFDEAERNIGDSLVEDA